MPTAPQGFVRASAASDAPVRTAEAAACAGLGDPSGGGRHETVQHSVAEQVRGKAHAHAIESFRALLQRARQGIHREISPQHLHR